MTTPAPPRIALIHAVYAAMAPVAQALASAWPEADAVNLIDDGLPRDLERDMAAQDRASTATHARIRRLAEHAQAIGAQGVLFTCSSFGESIAAAAAALPLPVFKPNEAMFAAALDAAAAHAGQRGTAARIGMIATFQPAVAPMAQEFDAMARARGVAATLQTLCVPEAIAAVRAGDVATHDRLVAQAAPALAHCDAVMLAHFSTATALDAVRAALPCPVFSAPLAAVLALRQAVQA